MLDTWTLLSWVAAQTETLRARDAPMLQIRSAGGAVNDVEPLATAYAHRTQNFVVSAVGTGVDRLNERYDATVYPHLDGLYISFDADRRPERLHDAYPGETLVRLRELKARYDRENVFDQNFPIPPATGGEGYAAPHAPATDPHLLSHR